MDHYSRQSAVNIPVPPSAGPVVSIPVQQVTYGAVNPYSIDVPVQYNRHAQQTPYQGASGRTNMASRGRHSPTEPSSARRPHQSTSSGVRAGATDRRRTPRSIRVGNLSRDISKSELNRLLTRYGGPVESGSIKISYVGRLAVAQAIFKSVRHARDAVQQLQGRPLQGRPVQVEYDEEYEFRSPSQSDDSAGSSEQEIRRHARDGPLVIDGAQGSRNRRPISDSEDESEESSEEEEGPRRRGGNGKCR